MGSQVRRPHKFMNEWCMSWIIMVANVIYLSFYKYHLFHVMRYVSIYHSSYFHEDWVHARVLLVHILPVPPPLGLHHHPALLGTQHALHQAPDTNIVTNILELPTNIREVSQYSENAHTRAFFFLNAHTS